VNSTTSAQSSRDVRDWQAWLDVNGPRLLLFARQQTRTAQDAEDLLQDALVKLVEKIEAGEFTGGEAAYMPYLYTTIRRLAIDLGRRDDRRRRREDVAKGGIEEDQSGSEHPWFAGDESNDEIRRLIEAGLKALPQKFAEVIVMKIWGERTFAEIGEALDISPNTAASRYRYGIEALKKKMTAARKRGDLSME
jgi:RNA polymerase sigma-70 factor (ECF subfamily)